MFERGLPGYDDWLDNHGNPGGNMSDDGGNIWYWALEEQIDVTQVAENLYRIERVDGPEWFEMSFERGPEGRMLFNGKFVDMGDDFIAYVSITDDYHEQGGGEIGKKIRQEPFVDEE